MWANAERDCCPVKYRWQPLLNVVNKIWLISAEWRLAVMKPRRETHWHMLGYPKLANRSQPLVGQSSPYCQDMWSRYCCLTSFFWIADICLNCENIAWQIVQWCADSEFLHPVFSVSHVQHIWDLNSKFALRPHHVWKYVDIQLRPLRTGEEKKRMKEKKKQQRQNIMACSVGRP